MHPLSSIRQRRWLPFVGALLLLLGTAVPALARMTCVNGGHSVVQLGTTGDCCPHEEHSDGPTVQATCCEMMKTEPKRSDFVGHLLVSLPMPVAVLDGIVLPAVEMPVIVLSADRHFSLPPPDVTGRRLAVIGRLLI